MKYILDFDETIFNAKALKVIMQNLGIDETSVSEDTFAQIYTADPLFDITTLIFQDALAFLEEHKGDCEILSSYLSVDPGKNNNPDARREYQAKKIALCGMGALLGEEHVHLVGDSKAPLLLELKSRFEREEEESVFVDDSKRWIEQAKEMGVRTYLIKREQGFGNFERIFGVQEKGSITSFEGFLQKLEDDSKERDS